MILAICTLAPRSTRWRAGSRRSRTPEIAVMGDLASLRTIAEAPERARRDEVLLTERVALARAHCGAGTGSPPLWVFPGSRLLAVRRQVGVSGHNPGCGATWVANLGPPRVRVGPLT